MMNHIKNINWENFVIWSKKYRWTVGLLLLGLYFLLPKKPESIDINGLETVIAGSGQINKIISAQGKVSIPQSLEMFFLKNGKVANILVKEGQEVKAGDLIAELDTTDAMINLKQAKVNLAIAQSKLNDLIQGPDSSTNIQINNDINQSELTKNLTKVELENLKLEKDAKNNELAQQLIQLSGEIQINLSEYDNLVIQSGDNLTDKLSLYNNQIKSAIQQYQSAQIRIQDLLNKYDIIFGIDEDNETIGNRIYLGAKDNYNKDLVKDQLLGLINRSESIESIELPLTIDSETYDIKTLKQKYNTLQNLIKDIQLRSTDAYNSINNSIVSVGTLDQIDIDNYKNTVTQGNTTLDNSFSSLQNNYEKITTIKTRRETITDVNNEILNKKNTIEKLRTQYLQITNQYIQNGGVYDEKIVSKQNQIFQEDGQISYSTQKLNELVDSESIRQQQLQVQLQSLNIQQAEKDLKDYQIVSPFDGVIDNIDFQLHEYVDSSKRVTLSNKFLYRIEVEVDQIDVVSIEVGKQAFITLSPFPDKILTGIVEEISTKPSDDKDSLSYTVSVSYQSTGLDILEGMYGTVDFTLQNLTTSVPIITIPLRAIQYDESSSVPFVWLKQKIGKEVIAVKQNISLGQTDGNQIQIGSGILYGDEIIVSPYKPQEVKSDGFPPRPEGESSN